MSAPLRYTEREKVLLQQEAFCAGVDAVSKALRSQGFSLMSLLGAAWKGSQHIAIERYPYPKVTRPRVVKDRDGVEWRVADDVIQWRYVNAAPVASWATLQSDGSLSGMFLSRERVEILAALIASPTETVEEES